MPKVQANGIEIEFDHFGDPAGRPLLLVMGLGAQMILWDEEFCEELVSHGHFVVRFDNRDVGLSTKLDHAGAPDILALMARLAAGEPLDVPYTLDDMADDAAALLDAIGLPRAHVCGASMGGMIAQTIAIRHPQRVRSLVSIMSTTGDPRVPPATPEAMQLLLAPPPETREAQIQRAVEGWRVIGSARRYPEEEERIRLRGGRVFDRSFHPDGAKRQMAAILAHGSREEALAGLRVPTLVLHGDADPLVHPDGGRRTAAAIPGAELELIEGMAHDLPAALWPRIAQRIARHTHLAEA